VYSTGIGWRRDLVSSGSSPDALPNPYDAYWRAPARGAVGLYDDYREVIAMALLRRGEDPNGAGPGALDAAIQDLLAMPRTVEVDVSADGAYRELQTGGYAVQQAWSGDVLSAQRFGDASPSSTRAMGFTWPAGGVVGCDLTAVCARGRNPVLAHAFVDFLLEEDVALDNFAWNGYQPPVSLATPASFEDPGFRWASVVPEHLRTTLLAPDDLESGRFLRPLSWSSDAAWRDGWRRFLSAVQAA
jgi:spermidine/putrescine transport system substrate-binding protein